jgi:hypothetical protein
MTTTIPNTRASQSITIDTIQANIDKAQQSFVLSKDSSIEAAAHVYIVYDETQSEHANPDAKDWMERQIEDRNTEIDEHNEKVASDRKRAKAFKAGTLSKDDLVNTQPANEANRKEIEEERARLTELAELTDEDWAARRKVRVGARKNTDDFTTIVKLVLNFDRRADASVTSRFATVLEWIHAHFNGVEIQDVSQIVTAIKDAGGFEAVLNEQRNKGESGDSEDAEEREINAKEIATQAKAAVQTATAIATIDMQITNAPDGIVLLIGRYVGGKVEVVDDIPLEAGEVESMVSRVSDDLLPPISESAEFVARVLALGDIVVEGKATDKTRDETVMGEKLVEERTLSLLPDGEENIQLVISALHADSSAVIKAIPEPSRVSLGKTHVPMMMAGKSFRNLEKMLRDRTSRRLTDIVADVELVGIDEKPTLVSWTASNSALIAKGHANGRRKFFWEDMTQHEVRPLDVDNFSPQFTVSVSAADMTSLYQERLKIWRDNGGSKKNDKLLTLSFRDASMICKVAGEQDLATPCVGTIPAPAALSFRPRDLHDLVLKLNEQHAQTFDLTCDDRGLLCVSWSDHLGSYSVYLPTSTKGGRLETRRIAPMRVSSSGEKLAA